MGARPMGVAAPPRVAPTVVGARRAGVGPVVWKHRRAMTHPSGRRPPGRHRRRPAPRYGRVTDRAARAVLTAGDRRRWSSSAHCSWAGCGASVTVTRRGRRRRPRGPAPPARAPLRRPSRGPVDRRLPRAWLHPRAGGGPVGLRRGAARRPRRAGAAGRPLGLLHVYTRGVDRLRWPNCAPSSPTARSDRRLGLRAGRGRRRRRVGRLPHHTYADALKGFGDRCSCGGAGR